MSIRAEADKSVESQTPNVNRNKTENIEAGNISNENAEKRADIGKDREPTPAGEMQARHLVCCSCRPSHVHVPKLLPCPRTALLTCRGTGL